jgi:hypothetical protein
MGLIFSELMMPSSILHMVTQLLLVTSSMFWNPMMEEILTQLDMTVLAVLVVSGPTSTDE